MKDPNKKKKITAAVWCVPFSGAVGLFNKLQTQKIKEGLGSEAPIAPKLHKRPCRRRAKQIYSVSIEWTGTRGWGVYSSCRKGFQGTWL